MTYPIKWNKILSDRFDKDREIEILEAQKKELDAKIKNVKNLNYIEYDSISLKT